MTEHSKINCGSQPASRFIQLLDHIFTENQMIHKIYQFEVVMYFHVYRRLLISFSMGVCIFTKHAHT